MAIGLDYQGAFDNISTTYLTSFLTHLNFPPNIVNYFQKLSEKQTAIIKNFHSNKIPIQCGVSQGLASSGDLFCLSIIPIYLAIQQSNIIKPYKISSKLINPNVTENFLEFPKNLGFSDDLVILTHFDIINGYNCPQLDFILKIHEEFNFFSGLKLNASKSGLLSPVKDNIIVNEVCKKYGFLNLSNSVFTYLGHKIDPTNVNSPHPSIAHVTNKLVRISSYLRHCGAIGRSVLSKTLMSPIALYASNGWTNTRVKDLQSIQDILDKVSNSKFKGNSKYLRILQGGANNENVYSRYVSTQITFFQRQLLANNRYYEKINDFLTRNLKLKLNYGFSHGIKMLNLLNQTMELLNLPRLKNIFSLYKIHIFPI